MNKKEFFVKATTEVKITEQDIDDIMAYSARCRGERHLGTRS